ncbi:MAG: 50S ribosomal protein L31e [Candidatus Diapherotrites archaeon]|nr:50S ribosomal protein L31e [Candidatus Diapherotrites archaeon]
MAEKKEKGLPAIEKNLTISLRRVFHFKRNERTIKAITFIKRTVTKHTRINQEFIRLSNKVNETIWQHGRESVPRKISIKIILDKGKANVFMHDEKVELPKEEKMKEKKEGKKTEDEKKAEEEKERKKGEKRLVEKAADASAIKRGRM